MKKAEKIQYSKELREFALVRGVEIVGFAPIGRFRNAPKGFHPRDIMPDTNSVIVIGKYFPLGALEGNSRAAVTKTHETIFAALDRCAYELSCFVEKLGGRALPVPADIPYSSWNATKQHGRGDLSHRHAAVLAGLGSLGKNSLLLTSQFGNRVNLTSILTNLSLEGDPLFKHELCISECDRCVQSCPADAIRPNGKVLQKECRKFHTVTTPRGFKLYACWECRKVCPVRGTLIQK